MRVGTPTMGMLWHKQATNRAVGVMQMIPFFIIALLCPLIYVNPSPQLFPTTGITTCAMITKEKPTSRAITTTAATPKEQRMEQLSKSTHSVNINSLLAEINLPVTQFDNVLEALHPSNSPTDNDLNNPCKSAPATEKNNQITPHASLMGVDQQTIVANSTTNSTGEEVSPQACVRISETATTAEG